MFHNTGENILITEKYITKKIDSASHLPDVWTRFIIVNCLLHGVFVHTDQRDVKHFVHYKSKKESGAMPGI